MSRVQKTAARCGRVPTSSRRFISWGILYAGAGAVTGGLTWVLSGGNTKAAQAVWTPSLKGDYWITPAHLKGERPLHFVGKAEEDSPGNEEAAPARKPAGGTRDSSGTPVQEKSKAQGSPAP
jgi:hypothetical protein